MSQTLLNFNLESTNEKLTPRAGVAILGEYLKGIKLQSLCNSNIPQAKRANGYTPFEFIYPLLLMLHSGGRVLDDIKEIRTDKALATLLKIKNIPTASAFTKYLHKHGDKERKQVRIKELKNGFNMSYLPTSNFEANSFYFSIDTLAYNLFLLFKQILDLNLQKHTVKTIRYKLYNIAGKVVAHAREITLKVNEQFLELLRDIRYKAYQESLQ